MFANWLHLPAIDYAVYNNCLLSLIGVDKLVKLGVYTSAFPLHDVRDALILIVCIMHVYNIRLMETRLSDHNMITAVKLTADRLI